MNFYPHTAIKIPRQENSLIANDRYSLDQFWEEIDDENGIGLSGGIGCYIFSIRAGKGELPWYVGMAEKQSFRKECFTNHKLVHYSNAVASRRGTPRLTLIAKYTPGGKLVNPTGSEHNDIKFLETLLIANCLNRNPELMNSRDTKLLREMIVPGLMNTPQGKVSNSVRDFNALIWR